MVQHRSGMSGTCCDSERRVEANCLKDAPQAMNQLWELNSRGDRVNCGPETVHAKVYKITVGPTVAITQLVTKRRFKNIYVSAKSLKSTTLMYSFSSEIASGRIEIRTVQLNVTCRSGILLVYWCIFVVPTASWHLARQAMSNFTLGNEKGGITEQNNFREGDTYWERGDLQEVTRSRKQWHISCASE
ncbi:hypothetical protein B0H13DRAFT_1900929 [Mycena leptocephala]|nr:hypothetical protein B0H13DRAFT_1900929 [Mycena leptocephala]